MVRIRLRPLRLVKRDPKAKTVKYRRLVRPAWVSNKRVYTKKDPYLGSRKVFGVPDSARPNGANKATEEKRTVVIANVP
jgi:hypothetical protein